MKYLIVLLYSFVCFSSIMKLKDKLERDTGCSFVISSGDRSISHNKKVGGSKGSYHLKKGMALDVVKKCDKSYMVLGKAATKYFGGVIVYKDHLHLDTRPYKVFLVK